MVLGRRVGRGGLALRRRTIRAATGLTATRTLPPKVARVSPLAGQVKLAEFARTGKFGGAGPTRPRRVGQILRGEAKAETETEAKTETHAGVALGVAAGATVVTAAAIAALHQ